MPTTRYDTAMTMTLKQLMAQFPRSGRLDWIGVRSERRAPLDTPDRAEVTATGLSGDHYAGRSGQRAITLIQAEHLPAIAALSGHARIDPGLTRRNLVVSGINLYALRKERFRIGEVVLEGTGVCDPCSLMETTLGVGGYNAMRGHGGITACVIESGWIQCADPVTAIMETEE